MTDENRDHGADDDLRDLDPRLGLAAVSPAPPGLKARVLAALDEPRPSTTPRPGVTVVRTDVPEWKDCPFPGVQFKEIHRDAGRRSRSILYRMEPGSKFPDHRHSFLEEIFVLEGSALLSGQLLRAGDYCRSEPGTEDYAISSQEGALFVVFLSEEEPRQAR